MRTTTLAMLLGGAIIFACTVDRRSPDLACSSNTDCEGFSDNRACMNGYCIPQNCPDDCTSCNEAARTCQVDCTTTASCAGTIRCPDGWTCTISCVGTGACDDISCDNGSSCAITCSGDGSCGNIDCNDACKCDLDCVGAACGSKSCPSVGGGANQVRCTVDGNSGTECDSARDPRCASC